MSQQLKSETNRTAILLLDFQNEFVKKGGKLHDDVTDTMGKTGVLQNVPKLVEFARKMDALIIYSPVVMSEAEHFNSVPVDREEVSASIRQIAYTEQFGLFTENTWNCEIVHEVEPRNDDIILHDRCDFSAFAGTKLVSYLKENNVKHFFVTGFLTDVCVYRTSTDATRLLPDMSTYVVSDGCAAKSMDDHKTALEKVAKKSVKVVSASEAQHIFEECAVRIKERVLEGGEEWLMIDKIFSAAGVAANQNLSVDRLQSLIKSMPSSFSILTILSDSLGGMEEKSISKQDMHNILFRRKARRGFLEKLPIFIAMMYMPFLYSASTRLPFIFIALEIIQGRGRELWQVGLVLGVYQTSRALGNLFIVVFGGKNPFIRLQILMILVALFGWFFLALWGRPAEIGKLFSFEPYLSDGDGDILPLFALFFVGFCETIVILQRTLMIETAKESPSGIIDDSVLLNRFSLQYAFVSLGSCFAFVLGGWLYTYYGFYAACDFGILIQLAHLLGAVLYVALAKKTKKSVKGNELDGNDLIRSVIYQFQAVSVILKYASDVANGTENALNSEAAGLSAAAITVKSDRVLNHSLSEMYRCFFSQGRDDIASMEELLKSVDKSRAQKITSLASKRPLVMAIGKQKLSKLVLFLMKSKGDGSLTEGEFISFWAPRIYLSMFESSQEASVSVVWPYMKAVVLTQAIAALCIGTFLSTALLSYTERFGIDAATVGILLGIGEGLGMVIIFAKNFFPTCGISKGTTSTFPRILATLLSRPLNVPMILFVASGSAMFFSINNLVVAICCQMLHSSVNDLSVSYMNELIGTSLPADKFKLYQGIGQWLRRLGNMVTAILGPILFGVDRSFPFLFFGAIVLVWSLILWFLMYAHADRMQQSFEANNRDDDKGESEKDRKSCLTTSGLAEPIRPFAETSRTQWSALEQRYYALNKERVEEELNAWKKASVDISLMEHRIRRIAAALEVEKDQRRALEDRMYARVATAERSSENTNSMV